MRKRERERDKEKERETEREGERERERYICIYVSRAAQGAGGARRVPNYSVHRRYRAYMSVHPRPPSQYKFNSAFAYCVHCGWRKARMVQGLPSSFHLMIYNYMPFKYHSM